MFRSQLIRLLVTLSPKEIKNFNKFLNSPIFNIHQDTIRLFEVLEKAYPDFSAIESETLFEKLFPGQPYKDEVLRTLRKYLLGRLKDFLAYQNWQQQPQNVSLSLLEDLSKRESEDDFVKEFKKSQTSLNRTPIQDSDHFLIEFHLKKRWIDYETTSIKRQNFPDLESLVTALDHFYLAEKLQFLASDLSTQRIFKRPPSKFILSQEILNHVLANLQSFPMIIQVYGLACQFMTEEENGEETFMKFRGLLSNHTRAFSNEDLSNLYIYAINFANQGYLHGKENYLQLMFELYNEMLELDLLFEGKTFSLNNYKNLTTLGLRLKKLDWVEDFIETYKVYLDEENWEAVYNYNLAHLYIYQGKYSEALRLLQEVSFLDSFYQLSTKMLQLKIYFEQKDVEMFFTLSKTFETHVKRQKEITEHRKTAFINFIKTAKAIFRIKIGEKDNREKTYELIQQSIPLIEKEWIKEQYQSL